MLFFKIPKKTPSATTTPALDEPVIQRRRKLIDDCLDASVVCEDDQDVVKRVEALQAKDSLFRLVGIMAVGSVARISLDFEEWLRPVVGMGVKETGNARPRTHWYRLPR